MFFYQSFEVFGYKLDAFNGKKHPQLNHHRKHPSRGPRESKIQETMPIQGLTFQVSIDLITSSDHKTSNTRNQIKLINNILGSNIMSISCILKQSLPLHFPIIHERVPTHMMCFLPWSFHGIKEHQGSLSRQTIQGNPLLRKNQTLKKTPYLDLFHLLSKRQFHDLQIYF